MPTITVCNHKGGTGKTTTTIHVAAALGLSGHRVLVVDLDPQGFLTRMVGLEEPAAENSSAVLFGLDGAFDEVEVKKLGSFDLLPSSTVLTKKMRGLNKPTDVLWVKEAMQEVEAYDVVLFDTAAAVTVYSLNALVASEHALIPVTPEYQPVVGAEQTYQTVEMIRTRLNPELRKPHFIFTQVDGRKRTHHRYRQYMRKSYRERVLDTMIRTSAALASSYNDGKTVFHHDPYSRGARDYANATDELWNRVTEEVNDVPSNVHVDEEAQVDEEAAAAVLKRGSQLEHSITLSNVRP